MQQARDASDLVFAELKDMKKQQAKEQNWQAVNDRRAEARRLLNEAEEAVGGPAQEVEAPPSTRPAQTGDPVGAV